MIVLEYLKEFQGIIGTVIGLFSGYFLRTSGTVKAESLKFECHPYDNGPYPGMNESEGQEYKYHIMGYDFTGTVLFENTSESIKGLKNLRITAGGETETIKVYAGKSEFGNGVSYRDLIHLNIPGTSIEKVAMRFDFSIEKLIYSEDIDIYVEYDISGKLLGKSKKVKLVFE